MESSITDNQKNIGAFIHLSTLSKYVFPFANFFVPLMLWTTNKEKPFVDEHGRQAINFQLSILLYTISIGILCIPFLVIFATDFISFIDAIDHSMHEIGFQEIKNISGYIILIGIAGLLLAGIFIFELYCIISATLAASNGKLYKYPLSISFIKFNSELESEKNHTNNEHLS